MVVAVVAVCAVAAPNGKKVQCHHQRLVGKRILHRPKSHPTSEIFLFSHPLRSSNPFPHPSISPYPSFLSPSPNPLQNSLKMADEVYDGAIGIDLGE
jgi:hypothetical protein